RAARAERVAVVALGAADAEPVGVLPEDLLDRRRLRRVVERRRRPVGVDVTHLAGCDAGIDEGELHRAGRLAAVGARRGHMVGVVREGVAHAPGVDLGAPGAGTRPLLGDQHGGSLTHSAPVAVLAERARAVARGAKVYAELVDYAYT